MIQYIDSFANVGHAWPQLSFNYIEINYDIIINTNGHVVP